MRGTRATQIGVDRLIRLAWLEKASSLVLAGSDATALKTALAEDLIGAFRSTRTDVRGSLDKTITILSRVWCSPPAELVVLHKNGLEFLRRTPVAEHAVVHWGMLMAVYPFWGGVATQAGRLLRLQGTASAIQIQRRVREQYGERETVARRARYVLRSFLDWGVLQETEQKGVYQAAPPMGIDDIRLIAWLIEAFLRCRASGSAPLKDLIESPSLFPFRITPIRAESLLTASSSLDIMRHGLDEDLVMLR